MAALELFNFLHFLGLAFGLGGKDAAAKLIEDLKEKVSEK